MSKLKPGVYQDHSTHADSSHFRLRMRRYAKKVADEKAAAEAKAVTSAKNVRTIGKKVAA